MYNGPSLGWKNCNWSLLLIYKRPPFTLLEYVNFHLSIEILYNAHIDYWAISGQLVYKKRTHKNRWFLKVFRCIWNTIFAISSIPMSIYIYIFLMKGCAEPAWTRWVALYALAWCHWSRYIQKASSWSQDQGTIFVVSRRDILLLIVNGVCEWFTILSVW